MTIIKLKPVFSSNDIGKDLIFINCTLGYNGNINLLFAVKNYDNLREIKYKNVLPKDKNPESPKYRVHKSFKIYPKTLQSYKLFILEENKAFDLFNKDINYTHGLQIDSDKFCLACWMKTDNFHDKIEKNCEIYDINGDLLCKYDIGTRIRNIQTCKRQQFWVSYDCSFVEEGIKRTGLTCFNIKGKVLYRYNSFPCIAECDALNVCSDKEVLINNYCGYVKSWRAFVRITDKKHLKSVAWSEGTKFIASSGNFVLVQNRINSFDINSRFAVLDMDKFTVNLDNRDNYDMNSDTYVNPYSDKDELDKNSYEFFNENDERLNCVHAQKDTLYFCNDNKLYTYSMN